MQCGNPFWVLSRGACALVASALVRLDGDSNEPAVRIDGQHRDGDDLVLRGAATSTLRTHADDRADGKQAGLGRFDSVEEKVAWVAGVDGHIPSTLAGVRGEGLMEARRRGAVFLGEPLLPECRGETYRRWQPFSQALDTS